MEPRQSCSLRELPKRRRSISRLWVQRGDGNEELTPNGGKCSRMIKASLDGWHSQGAECSVSGAAFPFEVAKGCRITIDIAPVS